MQLHNKWKLMRNLYQCSNYLESEEILRILNVCQICINTNLTKVLFNSMTGPLTILNDKYKFDKHLEFSIFLQILDKSNIDTDSPLISTSYHICYSAHILHSLHD